VSANSKADRLALLDVDFDVSIHVHADGREIVALAHSREHLLEISDILLRLLAVSVHSVILGKCYYSRDSALINAPTLAYLMEQCQSLKALTLEGAWRLFEA
jgi:hypothetical protein